MSYKSIDLQTSLPRTMEMAPLQHQQQQRPATEQTLLGQHEAKAAEQQARRSAKTESASNGTISERQPRQKNKQATSTKRKADEAAAEENKTPEHPYKGKHIDFMG
ncbi:hypothetical protein D7Z26_09880 [Cohnella endophytica]|uniref:RNA polymerase subunit sigma n=1 Tax=Cohnella endophytica TaxID=2419778 RepID=A0A494XY40_9BACL|nr:hypothetical protein [Cohnella endophytica]RKP55484.1 hypothetical protein D7Z26_09880 [Cohnella endophytica]